FFISFQMFSNYNRLVRTTAWVLRFVRRCRGQYSDREKYGLTANECANAERILIRQAQSEAFFGEER
ncbi:hypothetical protein KR038_005142, partial [Drosophila bunnanda]